MHDVICFGSATIDAFVETEKNQVTTQCNDDGCENFITYRSGEKILITHLHFDVGGGGTNTAVAFARLGLATGYAGSVGSDDNARIILDLLHREHVAFLGTQVDEQTNYSVVLDSKLLKDRTILVYKGASESFEAPNDKSLAAKWYYISSLSGKSFSTVKKLVSERENTQIAINPSGYQIRNNKEDVLFLLKHATISICNKEEAALLVGEGSDKEILSRLHSLGPHIVIITNGKEGALVSNGKEILRGKSTPNLAVTETTGAGDCFASTFVAAIAAGKDTEEALCWAFANVEEHIQHIGAKSGLLTRHVLEERVKTLKRVIERL